MVHVSLAGLLALVQGAPSRGIARLVDESPVITLLGLLVGAFTVGFAARKYFEDRELSKLRHLLEEAKEKLAADQRAVANSAAASEENGKLVERLASFISSAELKRSLAKYLLEFPAEKHEAILAALMRQLLAIPGWAWLCTPTASVRVHADFDEAQGASLIQTTVDILGDPIGEVRKQLTSAPQLAAAMLELTLFGIARVVIKVNADQRKEITMMQAPGLTWKITTHLLQRQSDAPQAR